MSAVSAPTRCRSCGRMIVFVRSLKGKAIPCDDPGHPTIFFPGTTARVVTRDGEVVTMLTAPAPVEGYESHFATCTEAAAWRNRRTADQD